MRRALAPLLLAATVLVVAWFARASEGARAIADCDAAFARGDRVEAIVLARVAAEARCPRCSAPELGYARLEAIAKNAEARADDETAVAAWRAARAAALGSALFDTSPPWRERADTELARLEHRVEQAAVGAGATPSPAASEEHLRAALARTEIPSAGAFVLLTIGGALFLVGALRFIRTSSSSAAAAAAVDLAIALAGAAVAISGALWF